MIVADTSVWVEFFRGNAPWFDTLSDLLARNEVATLSLIFGELLQGAKNDAERAIILDFWNTLPKLPEDGLLVRAGAESSRKRWTDKGVGLIDSAIIIAARETGSFIWTFDKKLLGLLKREEVYRPA